ncbi:MAG: hypothetical protein DRP74_03190 [Candidatus Omnitrophota bacterium]|nr:MAG: hypothetical protein DRP74_03190 [Candidatus Omnitrophota bacterium]
MAFNKIRAFTLIEVLLVIIIVGILAAIVIPRIFYNAAKARQEACRANIRAINALTELWHLNTGTWPNTDLSDIFASDDYFPEDTVYCPVGDFGDTRHSVDYVLDDTTHRVDTAQHPYDPNL